MNTSNDVLNDIRNQLDQLLTLITSQQKDINKIQKWIAATEKQSKPKPCSAIVTTPEATYEFGEVTIKIDSADWANIKKGKPVYLVGQGWKLIDPLPDGSDAFMTDEWTFNAKFPGSLKVELHDPDEYERLFWDEAFDGDLDECEIQETPVRAKKGRAG